MADKVESYLKKNINAAKGQVAEDWNSLGDLYFKKLWHQLTGKVLVLLEKPSFTANLNLHEFFNNFVGEFQSRLNALKLVEIAVPVSKYIFTKEKKDAAFDFLSQLEKNISQNKLAVARLHTTVIELKLMNKNSNDQVTDLKNIRDLIDSTQKEVDDLVGVTEVHAPFYKVSSIYLREVGDFAGYYREALRYLGVEDVNKLTKEEKNVHAVLISFAAILGDNVYNFGELLAHPILQVLQGSSEQWLAELLLAFNSGDIQKFYALEPKWSGWDDFKKKKNELVGKIRLLAVMELALARPCNSRSISFKEVAAKCQVGIGEVEVVVMRAMAKGLVHGAIDQVQQTVNISWVQPRILDTKQILALSERISVWRKDVSSMENIVAANAKEILTQA